VTPAVVYVWLLCAHRTKYCVRAVHDLANGIAVEYVPVVLVFSAASIRSSYTDDSELVAMALPMHAIFK
jgi:hypothetical protein